MSIDPLFIVLFFVFLFFVFLFFLLLVIGYLIAAGNLGRDASGLARRVTLYTRTLHEVHQQLRLLLTGSPVFRLQGQPVLFRIAPKRARPAGKPLRHLGAGL